MEKVEIMEDVGRPNRDKLVELGYEDAIIFENYDYDSAIIGVTEDGRVVYSYDKMIEYLMIEEGWTEEESIEWIDFNTVRSIGYAGENGPIIVYDLGKW